MKLDCMKLPKIAPNCSKLPELCSNYNRNLPKSQSKIANIDDKSKLPHMFIGQPPRSLDFQQKFSNTLAKFTKICKKQAPVPAALAAGLKLEEYLLT